MLEMAAESQAWSSHVQNATITLMEKVLLRMEVMETSWDKKMDLFAKE